MTKKVIESFLAGIDATKTKVAAFPEYVAVFGGAITAKGSRSRKPKSQRDVFLKWVRINRPELEDVLILPESYDDWNDFDTYSDLLLFERDLGALTNAVLIFVEAPGAIAELGAFSQIDILSQRLVIVVSENRHPKRSFISLGPIRSVQKTQNRPSSVCVIPNVALKDLAVHMPVVLQTLDEKRNPNTRLVTFNKEEPQHQILLVLDFINLFTVTTIRELFILARDFGVTLGMRRLEQILFALTKTSFVSSREYGTQQYFIANKFKKTYIDFTAKTGTDPFNRDRTKAERWLEIQDDYNRQAAYSLASKEGTK